MTCFLYADGLVFCCELEEDLTAMVEHLKVNAGMSKMMALNEEEGLK